jgi:hypothetical protein
MRAVVFAACALLPACGDPSSAPTAGDPSLDRSLVRDTTALFQTDSLTYTLRRGILGYSGVIKVRFTNRTGGTVYFVNCNGITGAGLEKRVGGRWIPAWSPVVPACLSAPITVPAGGSYEEQIGVFGGYPDSNAAPEFTVERIPGIYRAVYRPLRSYQEVGPTIGEPLPLEYRVSNPVVLNVEPR